MRRARVTVCGTGMRMVSLSGRAAEIPETEQGAMLSHWLAGQWEHSPLGDLMSAGVES
jgi:hypothetical protein